MSESCPTAAAAGAPSTAPPSPVQRNLEDAWRLYPDVFSPVRMLYVPCSISISSSSSKGHHRESLVAFVDTGAQMTLISPQTVDRVKLDHLIDRRWRGTARGVGTTSVHGRIHLADLQLGCSVVPVSLTVVESLPFDLILGLETLLHHQMVIDLCRGVLRVGNGGDSVRFLSPPRRQGPADANNREDGDGEPSFLPRLDSLHRESVS
eukprot:NODE_4578_length_790_cov_30.439946_g4237_i0.p1 GENE.NODE_4578_length_790_cov_30.439946_g4237_i0~~NODE_4578_length_790_cov_30.439946_g4237_i0.p1  ORF type:complete len:207 (-),score=36.01 NODE_4578_length_790_cov_30.439946_g4237_i0:49-669(-)